MTQMVGLSATRAMELLPTLLPEIAEYTFLTYKPSAGVDERIHQVAPAELRAELARLAAAAPQVFQSIVGLPALISAIRDPTNQTLTAMLRHDAFGESSHEFSINRSALLESGLVSAMPQSRESALGLCSNVVLNDGQLAHLPLLDFAVPPSPNNCVLVESAARLLDLPHAIVLETGRSYHLYGLIALTHEGWIKFLARALLLAPMVDVRYVAHRLLSGKSVLRVNSTSSKPIEPHVVAAF